MSNAGHPNAQINNYIQNTIAGIKNIELVGQESKESIVFDEKEISWNYTFKKGDSDIYAVITVSEPLYFCNISLAKSDKDHFTLKDYLKNVRSNNEIEDLFEDFIDEKLTPEQYTLNYLSIIKSQIETKEVQEILSGEKWPRVPSEEEEEV